MDATTPVMSAASAAARAAGVHASETLLFSVLLQLVIIVLAGRLGGVVARHIGQSAAVGEIVTGLLLRRWLPGLHGDAVLAGRRPRRCCR